MKIEIFGIQFDNLKTDEVLEKIQEFLKDNKQYYIVLPYSEFVVRAQKNQPFKNILNQADLCLCESRGLYLVARMIGKGLKQPINGIELIYNICDKSQFLISNFKSNSNFKNSKIESKFKIQNSKLFLFGATESVIKKTAEKLGESIIGFENGYQDFDKVIEKINLIKPNILLVGLGSPKQEEFIYNNLSKMPSVKLAIGVGGAFDFISGRVKRAPHILQNIGLEWLWRLMIQPKRLKRICKGVVGLGCLTLKNMLRLKDKRS